MLRMPEFRYHHARSAQEAVALWSELGGAQGRGKDAVWSAMYVAGGTDLLPNIKHRLFTPKHLIGLGGLPRPVIREADGHVLIDGGALVDLAEHPLIREKLPPWPRPRARSPGPRSAAWAPWAATCCWTRAACSTTRPSSGGRPWATASEGRGVVPRHRGPEDLRGRPVQRHRARAAGPGRLHRAAGAAGGREVKLRDLYQFNGFDHLKLEPGELLTRIRVPLPGAGFRGRYHKLRVRGSIDFPQAGVAVTGTFEGATPTSLEIVVGAINPQPKPVRKLEAFLGKPLDAEAIEAIGELVAKQTRPQTSVAGDPSWRRAMAGILTRRALAELAAG
ncbi:MAG: FAD binding domain-containing protein [Alphaproteobacteria bacterium]|nr:FAD binding domain-containing protein [Alphaproteobacteria bacterium]